MRTKIVCSRQKAVGSKQSRAALFAYCLLPTAFCLLPPADCLWISLTPASHLQSIAMTNKEILQANLLDIVFENRNKNYGAYALRKNYSQRLSWALGISLAIALLLLLIHFIGNNDSEPVVAIDKGLHFTDVDVKSDKPKEQQVQKTQKQVATIKATDIFKITPNTNDVPEQTDFTDAQPSGETHSGTTAGIDTTANQNNSGNNNQTTETQQPEFHPTHKEAEFPGGKEAFARFLQGRLNTPDDLEAGQKQAVIVRFMVDTDGNISKTEIVQSAGEKFDKEVIRVLKKMPKWNPAEQNGVKVPVYFTQVVTFVGPEQ